MDPELADVFAKRHQRELDAEMEEQTRLHDTWLHQQVIDARAAGRGGPGTNVQDKQKLPAVAYQWEPSTAAFVVTFSVHNQFPEESACAIQDEA